MRAIERKTSMDVSIGVKSIGPERGLPKHIQVVNAIAGAEAARNVILVAKQRPAKPHSQFLRCVLLCDEDGCR